MNCPWPANRRAIQGNLQRTTTTACVLVGRTGLHGPASQVSRILAAIRVSMDIRLNYQTSLDASAIPRVPCPRDGRFQKHDESGSYKLVCLRPAYSGRRETDIWAITESFGLCIRFTL